MPRTPIFFIGPRFFINASSAIVRFTSWYYIAELTFSQNSRLRIACDGGDRERLALVDAIDERFKFAF